MSEPDVNSPDPKCGSQPHDRKVIWAVRKRNTAAERRTPSLTEQP